jgi:alpha-1,3/alpha-1,6-mannosyltransferase
MFCVLFLLLLFSPPGTLPVSVYGRTRDSLFGRFHVLVAVARMLYLSIVFALWHARQFDVVFVDQVAHAVPLLRALTKCKVMFYCHFPDALLSQPGGWLKRMYRWPVDRAEEWSAGRAQLLLVNSRFTLQTVARTWPSLRTRVERGDVQVLYPSIDFARYLTVDTVAQLDERSRDEVRLLDQLLYGEEASAATSSASRQPHMQLLVSINRFERKKNLPLALRAFQLACANNKPGAVADASSSTTSSKKKKASAPSFSSSSPHLPVGLLVCGGFDPANAENREHFLELRTLCTELGLHAREMSNRKRDDGTVELVWVDDGKPTSIADTKPSHGCVYFLRSFTDAQRSFLLSHALAVLYTPSNEHFGIVPVEAQFMRRPVIACNSGGPLESVVPANLDNLAADVAREGATGFLCAPEPALWARAIEALVSAGEEDATMRSSSSASASSSSLVRLLGTNGRRNVLSKFHFDEFQRQLNAHIAQLADAADS